MQKVWRIRVVLSYKSYMTYSLQEKYRKKIVPALREKFGYKNIHAVPKLEKVVVNSGVGKIINTRKGKEVLQNDLTPIKDLIEELTLIVGQKPKIVRAKKSIASFKLRAGMIAGLKVTLRGRRMYDFLSRLINIALPRMRDFRGIEEKSVDAKGNITIGIREQIIFPEIPHDKARQIWGVEVTLTTTCKSKKEGIELFKQLGIPFVI